MSDFGVYEDKSGDNITLNSVSTSQLSSARGSPEKKAMRKKIARGQMREEHECKMWNMDGLNIKGGIWMD